MEVACQLIIAKNLEYIDHESFESLYEKVQELSRMLNALFKSQKS
jgi:four helix bundle protein